MKTASKNKEEEERLSKEIAKKALEEAEEAKKALEAQNDLQKIKEETELLSKEIYKNIIEKAQNAIKAKKEEEEAQKVLQKVKEDVKLLSIEISKNVIKTAQNTITAKKAQDDLEELIKKVNEKYYELFNQKKDYMVILKKEAKNEDITNYYNEHYKKYVSEDVTGEELEIAEKEIRKLLTEPKLAEHTSGFYTFIGFKPILNYIFIEKLKEGSLPLLLILTNKTNMDDTKYDNILKKYIGDMIIEDKDKKITKYFKTELKPTYNPVEDMVAYNILVTSFKNLGLSKIKANKILDSIINEKTYLHLKI